MRQGSSLPLNAKRHLKANLLAGTAIYCNPLRDIPRLQTRDLGLCNKPKVAVQLPRDFKQRGCLLLPLG